MNDKWPVHDNGRPKKIGEKNAMQFLRQALNASNHNLSRQNFKKQFQTF